MIGNFKKYKLLYFSIGLIFIVFIVFIFFVNNYTHTTGVKIHFKNVGDIEINEFHGEHSESHEESSADIDIKKSGEVVQLKSDDSYIVAYRGLDGFESGNVIFNTKDKKSINIDPFFSEKKLNEILSKEQHLVQQVIEDKYPNISLYDIKKGKLYQRGEWYGTTLKYIGDDYASSDTLRIVLHKEKGVWSIVTDPPSISLSKYSYPKIPVDILSDVNNFQQTPMLEKFTNPDTSHSPDGQ